MYNINTAKKRLEPTETLCQFCTTEHSTNMEDNLFVPLFKENDRTNLIVYRSVKYSKIPVGVPRCPGCKSIHEKAVIKAALISWASAVLVLVLSFLIWGPYGFFAMLPAIFIGVGGTYFLQNSIVRGKGIYTKMDGAKQNEAVQDLILSGWSFTLPSA